MTGHEQEPVAPEPRTQEFRDLERQYRRLLAVFPWEHRRRYEQEMLAVLLAGARPGQRRPGFGETGNLLGAGLRSRLGTTLRGLAEPAWLEAAAVTGLLAALVLLAIAGHALLTHQGASLAEVLIGIHTADWFRLAGWTAVCAAVLAGLRRSAAGLAWAGVAAELTLLVPLYDTDPVAAVNSLWRAAISLLAATALTVPAAPRRALAVLGVRRLLCVVLALAAVNGVFLANALLDPLSQTATQGTVYVFSPAPHESLLRSLQLSATSEWLLWLYLALLAAAGLTLLIAIAGIDPAVRRRFVVLLAPVAVLVVLMDATLDGWAVSNNQSGHPIHLATVQWVGLIGAPVAAFAVGILLIRRWELTLRLSALGREVDQRSG